MIANQQKSLGHQCEPAGHSLTQKSHRGTIYVMNAPWPWETRAALGIGLVVGLNAFIVFLLGRFSRGRRERAYIYKAGGIYCVLLAIPILLSARDPTHSDLYWEPLTILAVLICFLWVPKKLKEAREADSKDRP